MMKFVFTAVATRALASTTAYSSTAAGRSQSDGPNSTVSAAAPSTIRCWSSPVPGAFPSNLRPCTNMGGCNLLNGGGWVRQEKSAEVLSLLLPFLSG
jgi:hypothetical protein